MAKLTQNLIDAICANLIEGCTYRAACASVGVSESAFYKWMKEGKNTNKGLKYTLVESVKRAEANAEIRLLQAIQTAGSRDWKCNAWLLERRFGYTKDGVKNEVPEETTPKPLPTSTLEIFRQQAQDLSVNMDLAKSSQSWQAYANLQRQYIVIIQQIAQLEAEGGMGDEMDGYTDHQLIQEIIGTVINLPPEMRQRFEAEFANVIGLPVQGG